MKRHLLPLLACPVCGQGLDFEGLATDERLVQGVLRCGGCARQYQVLDELPILKERGLSADQWQWEVDVSNVRDFDALRSAYEAALSDEVRAAKSAIIAHILALVSEGSGPILDVATGMGTLFRPLAARLAALSRAAGTRDGLASDVDESVLRGTQRKLRQEGETAAASFLVSDARHLALQDGVMGTVVSFFGFCNVPDGSTVLREAARVLRHGGLLAFSTLLLQDDSPGFRLAAENGYGELMSVDGVKAALEGAGLQLEQQKVFVSGRWPGCPYDLLPLEGDGFAYSVFTAHKPNPDP